MKRDIEKELLHWKEQEGRMPLLLRGARQVGKTYIVEQFGEEHFPGLVSLNFERDPELCQAFDDLDPKKILTKIEVLTEKRVIAGETLLFLDEIQECPRAIMALRYFKEQMPELHVIGAGSLLEFCLNDEKFRMPVGRVQFLFLYPLSFAEFLTATGNEKLRAFLEEVTLGDSVPEAVHQKALSLVREYLAIGGMPAVVAQYRKGEAIGLCQEIQSALLTAYRGDFGKYAKTSQHKYLQLLFEQAPGLIARWFKYSKVDPDVHPRELKSALGMLSDAGLVSLVNATSATGLPLIASMNRKKFKLLFLDVGLVKRATLLDLELLMKEDLMLINQGAIVEQFVGQELIAYQKSRLFFWVREKSGSSAEVDYVTTVDSRIVPIEVKSGATGRLKSLRMFMDEKQCELGVRISLAPLELEDGILSIPLYLISELPRLVTSGIIK